MLQPCRIRHRLGDSERFVRLTPCRSAPAFAPGCGGQALCEALAYIIERTHLHRALPFEIPAKHPKRARAEDLRCDEQASNRLPWIINRDVANQQSSQRRKQPGEESTKLRKRCNPYGAPPG